MCSQTALLRMCRNWIGMKSRKFSRLLGCRSEFVDSGGSTLSKLRGKGIITALQKRLLLDIAALQDTNHFYLAGGTALAEFYLGHRRSYDLDLFTSETGLVVPFSRTLERSLGRQQGYSIRIMRRFESFVELEATEAGEKVQVHLAYDSPFRWGEPLQSEYGVNVGDYRDLIVDKVLMVQPILGTKQKWRPQRDLNSCCRRERPVSWTGLDDGDARELR
jgi:Nucleotidyl transferase AbiEii toxin, Type IV TA system